MTIMTHFIIRKPGTAQKGQGRVMLLFIFLVMCQNCFRKEKKLGLGSLGAERFYSNQNQNNVIEEFWNYYFTLLKEKEKDDKKTHVEKYHNSVITLLDNSKKEGLHLNKKKWMDLQSKIEDLTSEPVQSEEVTLVGPVLSL